MIKKRDIVPRRYRGYSMGETVIALGVLGILIAMVGRFSNYVRSGIDDLRFRRLIQWETQNIRELIGTWPIDQVTQEKIQAIEVPPELARHFSDAAWQATISPITIQSTGGGNSTQALSVQLRLTGKYKSQLITPVEHYFWVLDETTSQQPESDKDSLIQETEVNR